MNDDMIMVSREPVHLGEFLREDEIMAIEPIEIAAIA